MGFFAALFGSNDNTQLKAAIAEGAFLVDVRTPAEFSSGSVAGAINIPLDKIEQQLTKFKNKQNIVVFCRSGARSSQAKVVLEQHNYKNVINGGTWNNVNKVVHES